MIIQNKFRYAPLKSSKTSKKVINAIHHLRFDPKKPYLISGNQFSVLYPRNLGVFYNSLLDTRTAHNQQDWENKQRIYLQSAMLAFEAFSQAKKITTTIVPIGRKSYTLTQVHPGSIASDSLYGILYAFHELSKDDRQDSMYKLTTADQTKSIIKDRKLDLQNLLQIYLKEVQSSENNLVKRHLALASARDGVERDSSFYDNVILWKTLQISSTFKISQYDEQYITSLRKKIIKTFWNDETGIFRDDLSGQTTFSADWLIALPTEFLDPTNVQDQEKIKRIIAYTQVHKLDHPLPIQYTKSLKKHKVPAAVKFAVSDYAGAAIWSYWGSQYILLLADMYMQTKESHYLKRAELGIEAYEKRIKKLGCFPETFDQTGNLLETTFYKSITETGWVVQYELAKFRVAECTNQRSIKASKPNKANAPNAT